MVVLLVRWKQEVEDWIKPSRTKVLEETEETALLDGDGEEDKAIRLVVQATIYTRARVETEREALAHTYKRACTQVHAHTHTHTHLSFIYSLIVSL